MKADGLFVIICIIFIFAAWVATGGPTRPISQSGPFLTPVTRPGEESQGYRYIVPTNPINTSSYPKQIGGSAPVIRSGTPDGYTRSVDADGPAVFLAHSTIGPAAANPNQEYATVVNDGETDVPLSGWELRTASGNIIPLTLRTLHAHTQVQVVTGRAAASDPFVRDVCERPGTDCIFLNRNFEYYDQSRETIRLIDAAGRTVDTFSY